MNVDFLLTAEGGKQEINIHVLSIYFVVTAKTWSCPPESTVEGNVTL